MKFKLKMSIFSTPVLTLFGSLMTFSLLYSSPIYACSCEETNDGFFTYLRKLGPQPKQVLVLGEIISSDNESKAEVLVKDKIKGNYNQQKLFVRSGDGANCGMETSLFEKGEHGVFVLEPIPSSPNEFEISICGINYLAAFKQNENFEVKGALTLGEFELLKKKFGARLDTVMEEWETQLAKEFELIVDKYENLLQEKFKQSYGTQWSKKWEAFKREGDLSLVDSFKAEYEDLKKMENQDILKIEKTHQLKVLENLEKMELKAFKAKVQAIL